MKVQGHLYARNGVMAVRCLVWLRMRRPASSSSRQPSFSATLRKWWRLERAASGVWSSSHVEAADTMLRCCLRLTHSNIHLPPHCLMKSTRILSPFCWPHRLPVQPAITVYNGDFGVVRDHVALISRRGSITLATAGDDAAGAGVGRTAGSQRCHCAGVVEQAIVTWSTRCACSSSLRADH